MYSVSDLQKLVQMLSFLGISPGSGSPPHSVVLGGGTNAAPGATGTLLASNGASVDPSFQTLAALGIQPAGTYAPLPLPAGSVGTTQLGANVVGDGQLAWGNVLCRICDSIAALGALNVSIYTRAFVTGYYMAGDGGGGVAYYYNASSSATVDGGSVIAAAGGVGRWLLEAWGPVSVRMFGAKGTGAVDDVPAINAAIAYQASIGGGIVTVPPGFYLVGSSIIMGNGVKLLGQNFPTITQANGANLTRLIDFSFSGSAASVEGLILDGNRSNNTDTLNCELIHARTNNDVTISNNIFQNSNGYGFATNGARNSVLFNRFLNCYGSMIAIFNNGGGGTVDAYHKIIGNRCLGGICNGGLFFGSSNYGLIQGNSFVGTMIGGRGNRLQISIAGNTVTWVSGPTFGSILPGMFVVVNGGMEFMVTAVGSSTSLTVNGSPPTLTNVAASIGTGDMMGIVNSSFCTISENTTIGQATFGIAVSLGGATSQCSNNNFTNNLISYAGKNAINVSWDSGTGFLFNNSFVGNKIFNPGNSPGTSTTDRMGIFITSQSAGKVINTHIDANSLETDTGDGQSPNWLGTDGNVSQGSVAVGHNYAVGFANGGIFNDVLSISLTAGWGSTASVSNIVSNGHSVRFMVTASGSGIAGGPSVTINKACDTPDNVTLINAKLQTTTGTLSLLWGEQTSVPGTWQLNYPSTPVSGDTYVIECQA